MSNLPPNPYNPPLVNANPGAQSNHSQPLSQVPLSQLPPGYGGLKQDANSNSPLPPSSTPLNSSVGQMNNLNQSANSSPAFNHPGMKPPTTGLQSSPLRPPMKPPMAISPNQNPPSVPPSNARPTMTPNSSASSSPFPSVPLQRQINDNAPFLIPFSQPLMNGPAPSGPPSSFPQTVPSYPPASSAFSPSAAIRPPTSAAFPPSPVNPPYGMQGPAQQQGPPTMKPPVPLTSQGNAPVSGPSTLGQARTSPSVSGPPMSVPPSSGSSNGPLENASGAMGPSRPVGVNGPNPMGPPPSGITSLPNGPPGMPTGPGQFQRPAPPVSGPQRNGPPGPPIGPLRPPLSGSQNPLTNQTSSLSKGQVMNQGGINQGPPMPQGPPINQQGPLSYPPVSQGPPSRPISQGPPSHPSLSQGPPSHPVVSQGPPSHPPVSQGPQSHPPMSQGPPSYPSLGQGLPSHPPISQGHPSHSLVRQGPPSHGPFSQPPTNQGPLGQPPMSQRPLNQPPLNQQPMNQGPLNQQLNQGPLNQQPMNQGPINQQPMNQGPINQQPMNQGPLNQQPINQGPLDQQPMNQGPPYNQPPMNAQPSGVSSNMQGRYPQMPQGGFVSNQPQGSIKPYAMNHQSLTQQMGQLSVTRQGFDQLWGHQMVDLMTCKNVLPEYPEDPPEIRLGNQFADSPNCSPEIFRCTVNKIPDTNSLLQKSRLPLGILIHPFKDLNHLPVIQCATIVRCRACRTYINPFVYFVDSKRWKCNLCYRVNDLPEEFQYDPVSKSYGDPSRRPEIKSATIEFIAPGEYMLRPPQPAVYLFLMDVSHIARDSGYLQVACDTIKQNLDQLPGDARTQVGFICYDAHVHCYLMADGLARPKEMTVLDIDDVFLPSPESLLVNLGERREVIRELLTALPQRHSGVGVPSSALGPALQLAYKLMSPTGGRVTVFQTCLPNIGPGALQPREDPNARSSSEVQHLSPATDFYKRLALDCSGAQIAVDLFLLNSQYADLASLSGMSKFSAGTVYHIPLFRAQRPWQADQFSRMLSRYLTRKIGFEAVMRVRCTRGITIHTFHGNFFVRSTDLLSLPNVSPDAGFGMQLAIEESLSDLNQVCFQAALLYTSSKGERRIRVHTLALPVATSLTDVLHSADQQCIIGLLSKMAVDRCTSASVGEAREALMNVAVDALSAHKLAQNLPAGSLSAALHAPASLKLLPLYLLALLKRKAFRTGTSTRLDDRVADMCDMKTLPLPQLLRAVYPDLYPIHALSDVTPHTGEHGEMPDPPRLHLSAERLNPTGAYLLDDGETMIIYVRHAVSPAILSEVFGVAAFSQLPDEARSLPQIETDGNEALHAFIEKLNDDRPYASNILVLRDNSPNRQLFTERLVDDRVEGAFSYYEFLQHIKLMVK